MKTNTTANNFIKLGLAMKGDALKLEIVFEKRKRRTMASFSAPPPIYRNALNNTEDKLTAI